MWFVFFYISNFVEDEPVADKPKPVEASTKSLPKSATSTIVSDSSLNTKYAKSSSISSDQFFGRGKHAEVDNSRLDKFSNSKSISSSSYFNEREDENNDDDYDDDTVDLDDVANVVAAKAADLQNMASSFLNSFRYN